VSDRAGVLGDVAYKVITSMRVSDHSTIAEFRRRHEAEIAELFDQVLGLCREAGLVSVGVVMVDGRRSRRTRRWIRTARTPAWLGRSCVRPRRPTGVRMSSTARSVAMSCPSSCALRRAARRRLPSRSGGSRSAEAARSVRRIPSGMWRWIPRWCSARGGRPGGRREWPRVARRELESRREREAEPVPRDREDRLFGALGRLEENDRVDLAANDAYERWRASSRDTLGRVMKGYSKPYMPPEAPDGRVNLSDPDSRVMRSKGLPHRQAYNVQTAVTEQQIILAAEISLTAAHFGQLEPMLDRALAHLSRHGITEQPEAVVGDAGYRHTQQIQAIADRGIEVLVPPDGAAREGKRPGRENGLFEQMRERLRTDRGRAPYARSRSSQCSDRSNTTGESLSSCEEGEPPCTRSYRWWQRPTTCTSSTTTGSPTPPEATRVATDTSRCSAEHPPWQESRSVRIFRRPGGKGIASRRRHA
jgi:Transposase DDE domain